MPGHLLVIPKRHIEKISELTKTERNELFDEVAALQEFVVKKISPGCDISEHYRPFIPNGRLKVGHLHVHIWPRYPNDELYEKVQVFEKNIFKDLSQEKFEKYKKLYE